MSRPATRPTEAARRIRGRGTDGRFELELLFLASGSSATPQVGHVEKEVVPRKDAEYVRLMGGGAFQMSCCADERRNA